MLSLGPSLVNMEYKKQESSDDTTNKSLHTTIGWNITPDDEMVCIRRSHIPTYLVHSAFFRSLDEESSLSPASNRGFADGSNQSEAEAGCDDKENVFTLLQQKNACDGDKAPSSVAGALEDTINWEISLPRRYVKLNERIDCADDLQHMLSTLRFWGVDDLPASVAAFCILYADTAQAVVDNFDQELVYLKLLRNIVRERVAEKQLIIAAEGGQKVVMQCLHSMFGNSKWSVKVCEAAARAGSLECLQYAHQQGCPWNRFTCEAAAHGGHILCLRYAHAEGCAWDAQTCIAAAAGGHLECLRFAHEKGCRWDSHTTAAAAETGQLVCLQYAHEHQCPWGAAVAVLAAQGGFLSCLSYAHENGCPWDSATMVAAAKAGHFECLKYAHSNGCPINSAGPTIAAAAAAIGHLESLQYMAEHTFGWSQHVIAAAAGGGHLPCVRFLHEEASCPWSVDCCTAAAAGGHLACLQYAHSNGCPWSAATCAAAAAGGFIACLEYAHQNNCPWDKSTCLPARQATHGHTPLSFGRQDCLEYYHQHRDIFADDQCDCTAGLGLIESVYVRGMSTLTSLATLVRRP